MGTVIKLSLILILNVILLSQNNKYAADFLNLDFGAKTLASGNSFFMNKSDLSAIRWFPADYTFNKERKVYSTYVSKFNGILSQAHIGFSQPIIGGYNITVNWNYSGVTDIPRYNKLILEIDKTPLNEEPTGFFNNSNNE